MRQGVVALLFAGLGAASACFAAAGPPRLELEVELDPGTRHLQASAWLEPPSRVFRFSLYESLQVSAATAEGIALPVAGVGRSGAVRLWQVRIPSISAGVRLQYGGTLPPLDARLDERAVLHSLPPMASKEGSFLPAGSAWYPQPAPLFSYRVTLIVPADQRAIVPGRLQAEEQPAGASGRYRASFEFSNPAEGIDLMAGPWIVREKIISSANSAPVRLRTYFPRDLDAMPGMAEGYLEDTARYVRTYGEEIGAYPFTEFSIVASALPTGFGMPTLTYMGADVLRLPFIRATSLGHEVLHNWWGNGVYVDYASGNWSEGLTTFMADYAYKEHESPQAAREMRQAWLRDFAAVPAGGHQALASFHSRTHGAAAAVGYGKSAMTFLMLRDLVGEDAFRRGVRAFWAKHRFRSASWSDLRTSFEDASGRPLAAFFDQWLNRAEGPSVTVSNARAKLDGGRAHLQLTVQQSTPAYALHVPVEIAFDDRRETRWIDVGPGRQIASLDLDGVPQTVRLDPDLRVWRMLQPEQLPPILRRWMVARAPGIVQVSAAADVREAGQALATRLCEVAPQSLPPDAIARASEPVLIVGLHDDVDRALERAGLPPRPTNVSGRGSAQVWTVPRAGSVPIAVISAASADALRALQRPLPHYGGQSWLVFDGSRALDRGTWPATLPVIRVSIDPRGVPIETDRR